MAVRIRLTRMGMKKRPFYRIVVMQANTKRDGRAIEQLGYYDPMTEPSTVKIDAEKALKWLGCGAQPTDTVAFLLKKEGIMEQFEAGKKKKPAAEAEPAPAAAGSK